MNVAEDQFFFTSRTCSWLQKNWHETAANLHDKISSLEKLPRCVETSKASVQCHISTPPSTANASLQNDHYDVTTELRKQILNLTEVVKQLTALKCLHQHEPGPASLPLLDDDSNFPTLDSETVAPLVSFNSSTTIQTYQETAHSVKNPLSLSVPSCVHSVKSTKKVCRSCFLPRWLQQDHLCSLLTRTSPISVTQSQSNGCAVNRSNYNCSVGNWYVYCRPCFCWCSLYRRRDGKMKHVGN